VGEGFDALLVVFVGHNDLILLENDAFGPFVAPLAEGHFYGPFGPFVAPLAKR
jgi:hypothetical protein